jgi:serine/threonine protein kinase
VLVERVFPVVAQDGPTLPAGVVAVNTATRSSLVSLSGKKYVLKVMLELWALSESDNEAKFLMNLDHPNIIKMCEYRNFGKAQLSDGKIETKLYLVLEHADIGTVFDIIMNCGTFNESLARFYFSKLVEAVEHIHNLGLAHLDIKPMNVLVKSDENHLKLADFGHACEISTLPRGLYNLKRGTRQYRPLEIYDTGRGYKPFPVDIFACGIFLFAIVLGFEPFFNI